MIFFDTSVLMPASRTGDPRHKQSAELVLRAKPTHDSTAAHVLTEVYSSLTRLPGPDIVPPDAAQALVAGLSSRLLVVSLTAIETLATIQSMADRGLGGDLIMTP